jgi:hypothetical protein
VADLVLAIEAYAGWLYVLLGVLLALQIVTMWRAGQDRDLALFALERDAATGKAVRAFVTLMLLVTIGAGVYTVERVVAPALGPERRHVRDPEAPIVTTPQLSELPTPSATAAEPTESPVEIVTSTPEPTLAPTATPMP